MKAADYAVHDIYCSRQDICCERDIAVAALTDVPSVISFGY